MNNKIIIIWSIIIFGLITTIYIIGINNNRTKEYNLLKEKIKNSTIEYLNDYNLWPEKNITVKTDELIDNSYLTEEDLKYNNSICTAYITITKDNLDYTYKYDINCTYK